VFNQFHQLPPCSTCFIAAYSSMLFFSRHQSPPGVFTSNVLISKVILSR
jgi:hypothetical protein